MRPLLGALRGCDGLVIGNGLGAAGLTIGPLAGRLLADVVLGREPPLDLALFAPEVDGSSRMPLPPLR